MTVLEFGDFQCPACGAAEPILRETDEQRPGVVRWVFKHLPLRYHVHAVPSAIAAECAHAQGLFWPMHDLLYAHQDAMEDDDVTRYAEQIGLDMDAFRSCLDSDGPKQRIRDDLHLADRAGVDATPTFFVNGTPFVGAMPIADFLAAIDAARQTAEASGVASKDYYSTLERNGCP